VLVGLLLVGAGVAGLQQRAVVTVGAEQARELAVDPDTDPPALPVRSGRPADQVEPLRPETVTIGTLDVTAEVDQVGVDPATRQLALPADGHRLGWYRHGPDLRASAGSMVIAGHVDTAEGPGAFFRLGQLEPGDPVTVTGSDGETHDFEVVAREVYPKSEIPLERYFARDGVFRLSLITCGGPFDHDSGHYRDNIVVTAVPVDRAPAGPGPAQRSRR
jgi:hypothetical protein